MPSSFWVSSFGEKGETKVEPLRTMTRHGVVGEGRTIATVGLDLPQRLLPRDWWVSRHVASFRGYYLSVLASTFLVGLPCCAMLTCERTNETLSLKSDGEDGSKTGTSLCAPNLTTECMIAVRNDGFRI